MSLDAEERKSYSISTFFTVIILGKYDKQPDLFSGAYRVLINLLSRVTFFTNVEGTKLTLFPYTQCNSWALSNRSLDQSKRDKLFFLSHLNKAF